MEKLFLELLNRSIAAGWLILAVIFLRLLFRRTPKWVTGILWLLIAVRLVNPFSVESVYSLIPTAELFPQEILYSDKPSVDTGAAVLTSWSIILLNPRCRIRGTASIRCRSLPRCPRTSGLPE
jgi:hypothetical protein